MVEGSASGGAKNANVDYEINKSLDELVSEDQSMRHNYFKGNNNSKAQDTQERGATNYRGNNMRGGSRSF